MVTLSDKLNLVIVTITIIMLFVTNYSFAEIKYKKFFFSHCLGCICTKKIIEERDIKKEFNRYTTISVKLFCTNIQ